MESYRILPTGDYSGLARMFYENGLEVKPEDPAPEDLIDCWEAVDDRQQRIAGIELEMRAGEYVIGGITVLGEHRNSGIGKALLETVVNAVRRLGGGRIMLVAKAPRFFEKAGFQTVDSKTAPQIAKCFTCNQFNVSCRPEVMCLNLDLEGIK